MILTKAEYIASINNLLADNSTQQISPEDIRNSFIDLVDSVNNFLPGQEINSANLGSPDTRSTRVGELALDKLSLAGRSSVDNSAVGYYSLGGNYNGYRNTAIGSHSMSCNLYGSDNVALGYVSLSSNIDGSGNVAIGNHTLQSNKNGDFNIAIGHGAGYYIGPNSNYKLYIAAHEVDFDELCDIPTNSGSAPLIYGDLKDLKLGIGVKSLHAYGNLQVSGGISPHQSNVSNIGHPSYAWQSIYANSGVGYQSSGNFSFVKLNQTGIDQYTQEQIIVLDSGGKVAIGSAEPSGNLGLLTVNGNIVPAQDSVYTLGHPNLKWDAVFNDIIVSGNAQINNMQYTTMTECLYECKTLHLATSGICENDIFNSSVCGYLNDQSLDGAGFEVHSSGTDYRRDYRFIYKAPDQTLNCLEQDNNYSRSRWHSNISLELEDGMHLGTKRVLSRNDLSLVSESGCFGLYIKPTSNYKIFMGKSNDISYQYQGDVNIVYPSGFTNLLSTPSSGTVVTQAFASRVQSSNKTCGFNINYYDAKDVVVSGQTLNRLTIRNIGVSGVDAFTILNNNPGSGLVGISNISTEQVIPQTIFNVQSASGCDIRFSSRGLNPTTVQLLSNSNIKASGFQVKYTPVTSIGYDFDSYTNNRTVVDFSLIFPSGNSSVEDGAISVAENSYVGIGRTHIGNSRIFNPNAPLTIYHNGANSGTVSLHEQASAPQSTADYGKVYVKPYSFSTYQTQSIFFMDDTGNEFNLIPNSSTSLNGLVHSDNNGNTYGGYYCPTTRPTTSAYRNTALGYSAVSGITTGSDNVVVGYNAGKSFTTGSKNVVVGSESCTNNSSNNVIIGYRNAANAVNNAILIGSGLGYSTPVSDYAYMVGFGNDPLISGSLGGPNGKNLNLINGNLGIYSAYNSQQFFVKNFTESSKYITAIQVKDNQHAGYNDGRLSIRFLDQNNLSRTLMDFDYSATSPVAVTPNFFNPSPSRPYIGVSGDIRLLGAIRFANGTSIDDGALDVALNFYDLPNAIDTPDTITTTNSHIALSVPSGGDYYVGRMTLQALADYVGSGFAAVSNNCNHIWSNAEAGISKTNNSSSVFIGCDAAVNATGWKHSVMIGTQAGNEATTPNVGLASDTACVFVGYQAGKQADQTDNVVAVGTNAGAYASSGVYSIFIGPNAGYYSSCRNSIGIGQHALRGDVDGQELGYANIEITAGLLDNQRLMYNSGDLSYKININNVLAGDSLLKRISVGHATLTPDAPFSVRKNDLIAGHSSANYIQTWHCNGELVAAIDCEGQFVGGSGVQDPVTIEGVAANTINPPLTSNAPTSGLLVIKNQNWTGSTTTYITNKDTTLTIPSGVMVVATKINGTYRPIWVGCQT